MGGIVSKLPDPVKKPVIGATCLFDVPLKLPPSLVCNNLTDPDLQDRMNKKKFGYDGNKTFMEVVRDHAGEDALELKAWDKYAKDLKSDHQGMLFINNPVGDDKTESYENHEADGYNWKDRLCTVKSVEHKLEEGEELLLLFIPKCPIGATPFGNCETWKWDFQTVCKNPALYCPEPCALDIFLTVNGKALTDELVITNKPEDLYPRAWKRIKALKGAWAVIPQKKDSIGPGNWAITFPLVMRRAQHCRSSYRYTGSWGEAFMNAFCKLVIGLGTGKHTFEMEIRGRWWCQQEHTAESMDDYFSGCNHGCVVQNSKSCIEDVSEGRTYFHKYNKSLYSQIKKSLPTELQEFDDPFLALKHAIGKGTFTLDMDKKALEYLAEGGDTKPPYDSWKGSEEEAANFRALAAKFATKEPVNGPKEPDCVVITSEEIDSSTTTDCRTKLKVRDWKYVNVAALFLGSGGDEGMGKMIRFSLVNGWKRGVEIGKYGSSASPPTIYNTNGWEAEYMSWGCTWDIVRNDVKNKYIKRLM